MFVQKPRRGTLPANEEIISRGGDDVNRGSRAKRQELRGPEVLKSLKPEVCLREEREPLRNPERSCLE